MNRNIITCDKCGAEAGNGFNSEHKYVIVTLQTAYTYPQLYKNFDFCSKCA